MKVTINKEIVMQDGAVLKTNQVEDLKQGFEDEFFSNLDGKFQDEFFSKYGNDLSPEEVSQKIAEIKSSENINEALRPELNDPGSIAKNAYEHLQEITPEDAPAQLIYKAINKISQSDTLHQAIGGIEKVVDSIL